MKSVLIIGLGRFGARAAEKLWELGHQIMVVDRIEARVDAVMSYATSGQIGDSTNRNFLESLGIPNFDFCIVSIGDDFQNSLYSRADLPYVYFIPGNEIFCKTLGNIPSDMVNYPVKIQINNSEPHEFAERSEERR